MQELNARDRGIIELLAEGWSTKSHNGKAVYQQMDIGKISLQNPKNPWRTYHA